MENNKIDRLFQDRLSRYEMEPSAGAWEAVQAQLAPQRRPIMWYAVAAAVAVLAVVSVLITRSDEVLPAGALAEGKIDHPVPQTPVQWSIPANANDPQPQTVSTKRVKPRISTNVPSELAHVQAPVAQPLEESELMNVPDFTVTSEAVAQVDAEITDGREEAIEALPGVSVQITYKSTPPVAAPQKSKIEKLWAKARDIKPGEMLGSIRETKNDFFNGKKN